MENAVARDIEIFKIMEVPFGKSVDCPFDLASILVNWLPRKQIIILMTFHILSFALLALRKVEDCDFMPRRFVFRWYSNIQDLSPVAVHSRTWELISLYSRVKAPFLSQVILALRKVWRNRNSKFFVSHFTGQTLMNSAFFQTQLFYNHSYFEPTILMHSAEIYSTSWTERPSGASTEFI